MQHEQPGQPTPPQGPLHDLPGTAQVFSAVFAVLLAAVVGARLSGVVVAVLTAAAAGCVCATIYIATNRRPWDRRKKTLVGSFATSFLALTGAAIAVAVSGAQDSPSDAAVPGSEAHSTPSEPRTAAPRSAPPTSELHQPEPIVTKTDYQLIPSSNPLTNDVDKVDLDTGCPGWGPTSIPVGRDRCGESADLILESTNLHTYEEQPRLALLDSGQQASWTTCHEVLEADTATIGTVQLSGLQPGSELCVLTDKDNVAAVHVVSMSSDDLVIGFEVWAPDSSR